MPADKSSFRSGLVLLLEVVAGGAVIAKDASLHEKAGFVFDLLDFDQKGYMDFDTAVVMVHTVMSGVTSVLRAVEQTQTAIRKGNVPLASEEDCEFIIEHALDSGLNVRSSGNESEADGAGLIDVEVAQCENLLWRNGWIQWVAKQADACAKAKADGGEGVER